jgi:hypothetical protein
VTFQVLSSGLARALAFNWLQGMLSCYQADSRDKLILLLVLVPLVKFTPDPDAEEEEEEEPWEEEAWELEEFRQ